MSAQDLSSIGTLAVTAHTRRASRDPGVPEPFLPATGRLPGRAGAGSPATIRRAIAPRTPSERRHLLEAAGLAGRAYPVPQAEVEAVGMRSAVNLVVRRRFGPGPVIALNAHGDVVPPGEGWTQDPYGAAIVGGAMFGRGVAVSKSDIATYAFALKALEAAAEQGSRLGGTDRAAHYLRRGIGRGNRPAPAARAGRQPAGSRAGRRLCLRRSGRAQRRAAPRGQGSRQAGARRDALHGRGCAGGRQRRS